MADDKTERPGEHDEPQDEVEAHHGKRVAANDEPAQEGDEEVEAHHFKRVAAPEA